MKKIALINDLSGFGKCSLSAAIPVVSAMGIQACPLPTAVLSSQTGFESFYFDDYTEHMNDITDEWCRLGVSFDGICSGYLGNASQVENVLYFLDRFKKEENIFLADPVMGDNGIRIKSFTTRLLDTMKELTKNADIITPNLTEACLLADVPYEDIVSHQDKEDYIDRIIDVSATLSAKASTSQAVLVTGIVHGKADDMRIGNVIFHNNDGSFLESPYTGKSFSGTGDLFASVVITALVRGYSIKEATIKAIDFLQPAIEEATATNIDTNHGIHFEKYLYRLIEKED